MSASVIAPKLAPLSPEYNAWRVRIFASTWLCYAGFYFCRHAFSIVKATLGQEMDLGPSDLANIWAVYLVAYAIGEFNAAALGSKTGARKLLLLGMGVSLGCNVVFGFANNAWTFMAFMFLNGLAQATGWSGNVGTMAHWFRREERGRVMGFWSTCYQIGGVLAKAFAAMMLGWVGWRWSFWGASLVLGAVMIVFFLLQRDRPEDVGLAALEDAPAADGKKGEDGPDPGWTRELLTTIIMMGAFYFFVKYIRYALWSWAPYFLQMNFEVPRDQAGYYSTAFDAFGFLGAITAGWLSDRVFQRKRALV
ncbi:MFS transporter, partial [Myxococcota bacterium]|nr:MFS transporter [Myxococcota bacterium]